VTIYHVASDGNDSAAGTEAAPWLTVDKFNASTFKPGDQVLFRCGDTFFGTVQPPGTRTQGQAPLVISSYGAGPPPNISNYKIALSAGWQSAGGNLWTLDLTNNTKWTGYQLTTGEGRNVGFLRVNGVYKGAKKWTTGTLAAQWDFHSDMATGVLTVYSVGNPSTYGLDSGTNDIRIAVGNRLIDGPASAPGEITGVWISGINFDGCAGHGIGDAVRDSVIIGCRFQGLGGGHLASAPEANTRYGNGIQFGLSSRRVRAIFNTITDVYDTATTCQGERSGGSSAFIDCDFAFNEIARCEQAFELYLYNDNGLGWAGGVGFDGVKFRGNRCFDIGYGWSHDVRPDQNVAAPLLIYRMEAPLNDVLVEGNEFYRFRGNFITAGSVSDIPAGYTIGKNYIFGRSDQVIHNKGTAYTIAEWASFAAARGTGERAIVQLLETGTTPDVKTSMSRVMNVAADSVARANIAQDMAREIAGLTARVLGTALSGTNSILTGAGTPIALGITPSYVGQLFQNTNASYQTMWYATGTSGSTNWRPLNTPLSGNGPPNSGGTAITPNYIGQLYVDLTGTSLAMWHSTGTASSANWRPIVTAQVSGGAPAENPQFAGRLAIDTGSRVAYIGVDTTGLTDWLLVTGWKPTVPATSTSFGVKGQRSADANYAYFCYDTDSWIRVAKDAW